MISAIDRMPTTLWSPRTTIRWRMWPAIIVRAARSSVQSEVAAITSRVRKSPTSRLRGIGVGGHRAAQVALGDDARVAGVDVDHGQGRDARGRA